MTQSPLFNLQQLAGARFAARFGWDVASDFGDPSAEYRAATECVALLDQSYAGRFRVTGKDALDLLNRLSSNKVDALSQGTGAGTILATPKGRVIDVVLLSVIGDDSLMLTSPQTRQRVAEWIDTYTFLEEAALEDVTESTAMITLLGPQALDVLRQVTGSRVPSLEPYFSTAVSINGIHAKLLRTDPTGAPGYSLVMASEEAEGVWSAVASPATAAVLVGDDTFNVLRLEAGLPRYGWELSEDVNPWEVDLGRFIHFDKGCYTGQEVVLRLNTYNKVQRQLVRLNFSSSGVCVGAKLTYGGDEVGTVTSVAAHPVTGEHIGLGLVHRPIAKAGADLEVIGEGSHPSSTARVMDIPSRTPVPA